MAEYIDREKIFPNGVFYVSAENPETSLNELINRICNLPTADVVPKSEVENIFAEIETFMKDFEDDDDGYLLKKCEFEFFMREIKEKYAGQKNG